MVSGTREVWADGPSLLTSMLRHWAVILVAAVAVGGVAYAVAAAQDSVYEAVSTLTFTDFVVEGVDVEEPERGNPVRLLHNRTSQITSITVMERASELLGGAVEPLVLQEAIQVYAEPEMSDSIWVIARARTADDATAFATAVGEAYQRLTAEQRQEHARRAIAELDEAIGRMEARVNELESDAGGDPDGREPASMQRRIALAQLVELAQRRERLEVTAEVADSGVSSFQPALPPGEPVAPRPKRAGAFGVFLGLALGSAYAYWREGRSLVRSADDVRGRIDAPLLAELPRFRDRRWPSPVTRALIGRIPRAYGFLAVALDRVLPEQPVSTLVFAGVRSRRGGDASVVLNAALAWCQELRRVLLVDADVRRRRLTRLWRLDDSLGLDDLHTPRVSLQQVATLAGVTRADGNWAFVPAGSRQPGQGRLRVSAIQRLLEEVKVGRKGGSSLRVVLHGPPVLEVADVSAIARLVDGVVLVVFARTRVEDVQQAAASVEVAGGRVLGYVLVGGRRRKGVAAPSARHRDTTAQVRASSVS